MLRAATTFAREGIGIIEEIGPLMREHWGEVGFYRDIPIDPDFDKYRYADRAGTLRIFTARSGTELAGYAIYFVGAAIHYRTVKVATQSTLFVMPEYRRGSLGIKFIRHTESELKAEGCQIITQHVKVTRDFGRLLSRDGYELQDYVYTKRL
jgi:GNAT superfamily N-acetyltransferase